MPSFCLCTSWSLCRDATGTVKKSRKLSLDRGSGGSALVGVEGGEAPLKLELFLNQNCPESHQLTRMVVTHVYNTCTGERKKEKKKKKSRKVGRSEKVGKTASLIMTPTISVRWAWQFPKFFIQNFKWFLLSNLVSRIQLERASYVCHHCFDYFV